MRVLGVNSAHFGTINILGWVTFYCWGADLCIVECLAAPWPLPMGTGSTSLPAVTIKSVPKHSQMPPGTKIIPCSEPQGQIKEEEVQSLQISLASHSSVQHHLQPFIPAHSKHLELCRVSAPRGCYLSSHPFYASYWSPSIYNSKSSLKAGVQPYTSVPVEAWAPQ